ncbi:mediator of RNA polymerase II transcription subunit 26 [Ctenocephalides felis]|uniref:mediator of RNA polymerase II transcription subunit 26 n=1 Tax=Ctenocephalides felis TaxID=7515 RepID=UPI000E6E5B90|nr:mediator of RNA polymerase II transcription subunit 26 [Ctenocephalides felis]
MVNSVPELSQRLVKALDEDYNVIDMRAVLEIIATLEQTSVTEELLKTTRLGKLVNVLRKKTSNEELANRAKGLVKKWRKIALPLSNGSASVENQQRTSSVVRNTNNNVHQYSQHIEAVAFRNGTSDRITNRPDSRSQSPLIKNERPITTIYVSDRSQSPMLVQTAPVKRRLGSDLVSQSNRFSDFTEVLDNQNSNSSFHSVISLDTTSDADKSLATAAAKHKKEKRSSKKHKTLPSDFDSLSNTSESNAVYFQHGVLQNTQPPKKSDLTFEGKLNNIQSEEPPIATILPVNETPAIQPIVEDKPAPKKRGRKKGSKLIGKPVVNSYSDIKQKIASISGKTKIKTTKELLADLQNRKSQGLSQVITPSLSLTSSTPPLVKVESPAKPPLSVPNVLPQTVIKKEPIVEPDIIIDEVPSTSISAPTIINVKKRPRSKTPEKPIPEGPLTIQQILAQLPPIDRSFQLTEDPDEVICTCTEKPASPVPSVNVIAPVPKRSIFDEDYEEEPPDNQVQLVAVPLPPPSLPKTIIDPNCPAKAKYCDEPENITSEMLDRLHCSFIEGVNGNRDHGVVSQNELNLPLDRADCVPKYGTTPEGNLHMPLPKNPGSDSDCVLVHSNIQFSERNSENSSSCSRNEFKEWHEVVQRRSYQNELITILPYVVID